MKLSSVDLPPHLQRSRTLFARLHTTFTLTAWTMANIIPKSQTVQPSSYQISEKVHATRGASRSSDGVAGVQNGLRSIRHDRGAPRWPLDGAKCQPSVCPRSRTAPCAPCDR